MRWTRFLPLVSALAAVSGAAAQAPLFAPYVDMSLTADADVVADAREAGLKAVTLALLVGTEGCGIGWGGLPGSLPVDALPNGDSLLHIVRQLQAGGVEVILSFGGQAGQEPAQSCGDVAKLQAAYQAVLDRYKVKLLDFDIEGGAVGDQASITRRDQALVGLKKANSGLVISYTPPVLPSGLTDAGINLLRGAKKDGVPVDVVNVQAFDYGAGRGDQGFNAVRAARNTEKQIETVGLGASVGITVMIGQNDTPGEVFRLANVDTVLKFAEANRYVTRLAFWSLARDNGSCPGQAQAKPTCSGLAQSPFQFSAAFRR